MDWNIVYWTLADFKEYWTAGIIENILQNILTAFQSVRNILTFQVLINVYVRNEKNRMYTREKLLEPKLSHNWEITRTVTMIWYEDYNSIKL